MSAARAIACALLMWALALPGQALAQGEAPGVALPVQVQAQGVTVRAEAGLEALSAKVAERAPATLARIQADLRDLPAPERIEIRLVKRSEDLARVAPAGRGAPRWAAGVAWPGTGVIAVATRREHESIEVMSTLDHELAHLALDAALGDRAPRWLHEGFAYLHSSDFSMARAQTLTGMAWSGGAIPLPELDQHFPAQEDAAARAYAQSYDFVAFLARRGRYPDAGDDGDRWPFREFLAEISAGGDVHTAAQEVYGAPLEDLFAEWWQDLRQRYLMLPVGLFALGVWVLGALLLVVAWFRRRSQNRRRLARMAADEAGAPDADSPW